jgi:hypothetical protein
MIVDTCNIILQTEVLTSAPLTLLPKNILRAPSHNPTDSSSAIAYASLPNPSPSHPLRRPEQRFLDSEAFTNKFAAHLQGPMEKVTRRSMKRWSGEILYLPQYMRKVLRCYQNTLKTTLSLVQLSTGSVSTSLASLLRPLKRRAKLLTRRISPLRAS